jgi:hypothetical protein
MNVMDTKQVEDAVTPSGVSLTKQISEFTCGSQTLKTQLNRQIIFHQEKKQKAEALRLKVIATASNNDL